MARCCECHEKLPLPQTLLTQSFRFGEPIAEVANTLLKALQEEVPLKGNPNKQSSTDKGMVHSKKMPSYAVPMLLLWHNY